MFNYTLGTNAAHVSRHIAVADERVQGFFADSKMLASRQRTETTGIC